MSAEAEHRLSIRLRGVVQAVGFRPFVRRLAGELGLSGWVRNEAHGVTIEIEGPEARVRAFVDALTTRPPRGASIRAMESRALPLRGGAGFEIVETRGASTSGARIPPDAAPCAACAREVESPGERRYRYPFTNCTACGPRYSLITALPYDRAQTTMQRFALCPVCTSAYEDPNDRRFHAEPIACPACGPRLSALTPAGEPIASGDAALHAAVEALLAGRVCALKGVGGYQLLVDATRSEAVARLRSRKRRPDKPLAVMFPSSDALLRACIASEAELSALLSPAAPIVLVQRAPSSSIAPEVAPGNPTLGAMLPSSPLHRILLSDVGRPLVCTSGNLSNEPLAIEDAEAVERLSAIADIFLAHDRPITRPIDDSVARIGPCGLELLRRARGFVPLSLGRPLGGPTLLCLGGHLKATIALAIGDEIVPSQHLGDLESPLAAARLEQSAEDLLRFFDARPDAIACDLHPDYVSTRLAERLAERLRVPLERVQHHHAHIAACLAEHGLAGPALGLAWDGAGYGEGGDLWGGEALLCEGSRAVRFAHLRPFRLPGGEAAVREGKRAAAGLLYAIFGGAFAEIAGPWFSREALGVLGTMLERGVNAPRTTSVGRLFDAAAAIVGLRLASSFEGQAAMELEHAAAFVDAEEPYPLELREGAPIVVDWEPMVRAMLDDVRRGAPVAVVSARFHEALAVASAELARRAGIPTVALSGGCFQNLRLATAVRRRLTALGVTVVSPAAIPPNDGGLSVGQAWVVTARCRDRRPDPRSVDQEQVNVSRGPW